MRYFVLVIGGVILLNAVFLYSGGFAYIQNQFEPEIKEVYPRPEVVDTFRETLEKEVQLKIGTPIEGYEPAMFMQVFPGLVETDFNNVTASIGRYVVVDGQLEHQLDNRQLIHSAASAIARPGYETLYRNIAARIGVEIGNGATLTTIMSAITDR